MRCAAAADHQPLDVAVGEVGPGRDAAGLADHVDTRSPGHSSYIPSLMRSFSVVRAEVRRRYSPRPKTAPLTVTRPSTAGTCR